MAKLHDSFKKNTTCKKTMHGYDVECNKGLWGVCAPSKERALKEARHLFIQYHMDGEYNE